MENLPEPENVAEKMPPTVAVNLRERLATVSQKMKKDMRTAPDESDPGLAAQIVPLRDWLGMDLLNNKAISRNLDRVLEQLEQRATEAAKKNESNSPGKAQGIPDDARFSTTGLARELCSSARQIAQNRAARPSHENGSTAEQTHHFT